MQAAAGVSCRVRQCAQLARFTQLPSRATGLLHLHDQPTTRPPLALPCQRRKQLHRAHIAPGSGKPSQRAIKRWLAPSTPTCLLRYQSPCLPPLSSPLASVPPAISPLLSSQLTTPSPQGRPSLLAFSSASASLPASELKTIATPGTVESLPAAPSFVDGDLRYAPPLPLVDGVSLSGSADLEDWGWDQSQSDIIFVGTGTSEGIPRVSCLTNPAQSCKVCTSATIPGNKNRRRNTSLLVRYSPKGTAANADEEGIRRRRNILIDAGKFFYHSALQWFPKYRVRHLDAVVITHSHADAIGGLDCLRDWTNNVESTNIPIYVAERDLKVMKSTHYYLVDPSGITPGTAVSQLQFEVISTAPFYVHGLKFTPLPVWHGKGYLSFGYRFGNVCYISDVSEIPEATYPLLQDCDLLIMDALRPDHSSSTHMGLPAALVEVRKIKPKRTLFTGMMHVMDHEPINEMLARLKQEEGLDCALTYDGLRLPLDLS